MPRLVNRPVCIKAFEFDLQPLHREDPAHIEKGPLREFVEPFEKLARVLIGQNNGPSFDWRWFGALTPGCIFTFADDTAFHDQRYREYKIWSGLYVVVSRETLEMDVEVVLTVRGGHAQ
jgi:hypothetical protein